MHQPRQIPDRLQSLLHSQTAMLEHWATTGMSICNMQQIKLLANLWYILENAWAILLEPTHVSVCKSF